MRAKLQTLCLLLTAALLGSLLATQPALGGAFVPAPPQIKGICHAYKTGAQSLGAASWDAILFEAELVDTATIHDTSSNQGRFLAPTGATHAICQFVIYGTANDWKIYKDGSYVSGYIWRNDGNRQTLSVTIPCAAGSYLELRGYSSGGGALTVSGTPAEGGTAYYWHATVTFVKI